MPSRWSVTAVLLPVSCNMEKADRIEYLRQKRNNFQNRLKLQKKQEELEKFISELNSIESGLATVTNLKIDTSNIASPTRYNIPEKPVHKKLKYRTLQDELNVSKVLLDWIGQQRPERILIGNQFLIHTDDWLMISATKLSANFDALFNELSLLYTIMIAPECGNFISSFEFESEVIIYQGNLNGEEIKYYSESSRRLTA